MINYGVLRFVSNPAFQRHIRRSFLEDLTRYSRDQAEDLVTPFKDLLRMLEQMRPPGYSLSLKSVQDLHRKHDELVAELNPKSRFKYKDFPVPEPPFSGNDHIKPLKTSLQLAQEGREQKNCALSYTPLVYRGGVFFYKVQTPQERATLAISRNPADGRYHIKEIKGHDNSEVSRETLLYVQRWLDDSQP